ncbi:dicarboxylate/amino acid:cation symporter [Anaerococcus prevotii]|uniref:Transporter, dicarboxylate/amino acid:cation Na+/H+ symporter family protein n=1 Tax=Anaerococcus prevotii ACS-065-V-Col13 TaxID=879305 RepID=F0GXA6_9FIRM|nr:dicarboxylate/amino acid:cation symporter [Anaerococcus prevotii]EGC81581.1 transporter, dicarboxylate/amino acid:cation Na+/H+ symporter family protein [Anaerococcus prevotii ACS-065-V-Col13]
MQAIKKIGLIPRMILGILVGILVGLYLPDWFVRITITFSSIFGAFLNFIIPLMILAFVTKGIADLGEGAGKLLGVTVGLAYMSTLIGGSLSYFMANAIFPGFISPEQVAAIQDSEGLTLEPYFEVPITPFFDVTSAIIFAFMLGISISWLRKTKQGEVLYHAVSEFNIVITKVLGTAIVPLLPFFILGNFAKMAKSGSVFAVLSIFWKIFLCVIALHLLYVSVLFILSGSYTGKNPFTMIKNQIRGYLTAVGTQSSAATIPVNLQCAENNGVSREIRDFVIPLGATVHMPGSMITITACTFTILTMYDMPHSYGLILRLIAILGIAMVAAPGAPGGAVMSALPFLPVVGISPESTMASLLITLYLTQDSFGTAANISGDTALAVAVDKIYNKNILGKKDWQPAPVNDAKA